MSVSNEDLHVVYLLTRKSDFQQYVGITIERRIKQRMGDHKRSKRFRNDDFNIEILEKNADRQHINEREEYWIQKLDTFNNGLNESYSGKGYGHNSSNFTTEGYIYSEESRKKMSESAKKRVDKEKMRQISLNQWKDPDLKKHHSDIRKGKRLRPPKISDEMVIQIRNHYENEKLKCEEEIKEYNINAKKKGWPQKTSSSHFAKKYAKHYQCSNVTLKGIIEWKTRTKVLPSICKF